jgi:rod shape determining protein RodA
MERTSVWRNFDIWLTTAVLILTFYGVLMIRSAITNTPAFVGYETRQIVFALIGLTAMLIVAAIDYRILTSAHWYLYGLVIALLIVVLVIGAVNNEVNRWIPLGPLDFQPAELARVLLPVTLGQFLALRHEQIPRFSNTLLTLIYLGVPVFLIFIQPNLGMTVLLIAIWFGMMMYAGLPLRHFFILAFIGVAGVAAIYPSLAQYQRDRFTVFLNPDSDPEQARNTMQALISIGSGGWWGKGYFNGTQSQLGFLRVQHTDFIFSMLTEEMGFFFGPLVVIGLMGFILLRILRVASITPDPAGRYIAVGIAVLLFFQTSVSVAMNLRLIPVTGLTYPFISYGGSSLLTLYIGIGLVQSVLMRHRRQEFG